MDLKREIPLLYLNGRIHFIRRSTSVIKKFNWSITSGGWTATTFPTNLAWLRRRTEQNGSQKHGNQKSSKAAHHKCKAHKMHGENALRSTRNACCLDFMAATGGWSQQSWRSQRRDPCWKRVSCPQSILCQRIKPRFQYPLFWVQGWSRK